MSTYTIATTKAEADDHLEILRQERGFDGTQVEKSALVQSLDQALNILSDQLYEASTHFILELIQNADDNHYSDNTVPTLQLRLYRNRGKIFFRSDCNEVGFTFEQLDALTRVGQSTKAAAIHDSKRYIGEKGIGFKSVFKVADIVHIASGLYDFKFDRNAPIGMILPIPSRFPIASRLADHTQFLLELKQEQDYDDIEEELSSIEPDLLLFLRKLDRVCIFNNGSSKRYQRDVVRFSPKYHGETVTISIHGDTVDSKQYIVHRQAITGLPSVPQREGISSSEVVIAFMIKDEVTPLCATQRLFAFLPVGNFGFRFLIHADFILVASREGLDLSSRWNQYLSNGIRIAFVDAVRRLVSLPPVGDGTGLCYKWPKYLPRHPGRSQFWDDLHTDMMQTLSETALLESRGASSLQQPGDLRYVPPRFRFRGNKSLFDLPSIKRSHLSFRYDSVREELLEIGVESLNIRDLCNEFHIWIDEVGIAGIEKQPESWHEKISSVFCGHQSLRQELTTFPIVPLRDGSWVRASQARVFFPSAGRTEHVPAGIELSLVDASASENPARRRFLQFLGVQEYNPTQVCELIVKLHRGLSSRSEIDAVTDALYLFNHRGYLDFGVPKIYFFAEKAGECTLASSSPLYLIDPAVKPGLIAKYQHAEDSPFTVLSDGYEAELSKDGSAVDVAAFRLWLRSSKHTRFATTPVLLYENKLSAEWHFLRRHDVMDLMEAIRAYWIETVNHSPRIVKGATELQIPCCDGEMRALGLLALPTPELKQKCPHLDFAEVPEPTVSNWGFLSAFGVLTTVTVTALLRELQKLEKLPVDEVDPEAICDIYEALNASMEFDAPRKISLAFHQQSLVFIQKPRRGWVSHKFCVWNAPSALKRVTRLKSRYSECAKLFCSILNVGNSNTGHIIEELCTISNEDGLAVQRFCELFFLLQSAVSRSGNLSRAQVQRIQLATVFPVLGGNENSDRDTQCDISLLSISQRDWYIPDRAAMERTFRGKVPMLSMSVQASRSLVTLFEHLECEEMFLSSVVKQTTEWNGTCIRDLLREADLNTRLGYIQMALGVIMEFTVRVWSVPSISTKSRLGEVEIRNDHGIITFQEDEEFTDVYLREDITMADQFTVNFEFLKHLQSLFNVEVEDPDLINLLMGAPIPELPAIMERFDILITSESDDESTENQESDGENQYSDGENQDPNEEARIFNRDGESRTMTPQLPAGRLTPSSRETSIARRNESPVNNLRMQFENLGVSPSTGGDEESVTSHGSPPQLIFLHEVIPSHQARSERIIQQASQFQITEILVTPAPSNRNHSGGSSNQLLLTPPTEPRSSHGHVSSSNYPIGGAISHAPLARMHAVETPRGRVAASQPLPFPVQTATRSRRGPMQPREIRYREIGSLGEEFVYYFLESHIDDWSYENWTSKLRVEAEFPPFNELERNWSDFTYVDSSGAMKEVLERAGMEVVAGWSHETTFHLEVKTTLGPCSEPMFVSQNQLDTMRKYDQDPMNAYILIRAFEIEEDSGPQIRVCRDPWSLYLEGALDFRSNEGYKVHGLG